MVYYRGPVAAYRYDELAGFFENRKKWMMRACARACVMDDDRWMMMFAGFQRF